jgi:hypothetical protein
MRAYKNNFDRMLMGTASGYCALVSAISGSAITVTLTSFPQAPYFADMYVPQGARLEGGTFGGSGLDSNGNANSGSGDFTFIVESITSRDLANGTAIIELTDSTGTSYAAGGSHNLAVGDFLFREGAYGTASSDLKLFAACLEINGLSNLISDGASNSETASNYLKIWTQTRTSFHYLQSVMKDYASAQLTEDNLLEIMMDLQFSRQAQPNLLLTTPKAENRYFLNKKDDRRFNNVGPMDFVGGRKRMGIQLGDWQLILTSLGACPKGTLFIMDTNDFAFAENSPLSWVLGDGGNVLIQSHTGDNKFASAVHYVNFVCFDAYRQAKGYGISEV